MPKEIVENSFESILFLKGNLKTLINFGEEFIYTIELKKLGQWQLGGLNKFENVEVSAGIKVTKIEKAFVQLDNLYKVEYDFLVGADGSSSIVRKFLGIVTERWGVAYHYPVPFFQKEFKNIEIIFGSKYFYAWYAWISPYAKGASIGTRYAPRVMSGKKSRKSFENWTADEKISLENLTIAAHPINCDYRGYNFDNIFLVGDAAGMASGFTGEGIYQALIMGDEVVQIILGKQTQSAKIKEVLREKKSMN
jgi:flavin-dependent dehydrogenase